MQHKKLIEELLDDCNSLDTLVGYIELAPELDQLRTHLISIKGRILEAVDILKGKTMVKTFVKKPVEIHAVQWTGDNFSEIADFVGAENLVCIGRCEDLDLNIYTLEGNHHAEVGDWIIRGIKGEFYPCKPDIFEQTYEEVSQ